MRSSSSKPLIKSPYIRLLLTLTALSVIAIPTVAAQGTTSDLAIPDPEYAPDSDGDGVIDFLDNCVFVANRDQRDADNDGYGSLCDADLNNDRIVNAADLGLFKQVYGTDDAVADFNGDGRVDDIDLGILRSQFFQPPGPSNPDSDRDGIPDKSDNCVIVANSDQRDTDNDGFGSICDPDLNNDFYVNFVDLGMFRQVYGSDDENADFNGDGLVDDADLDIMKAYFFGPPGPSKPDTDSDNIPDKSDNCTLVANNAQRDTDNDGFGNFCDPDLNNDLIVNVIDLGIFRQVFGTADENADFNGDGTVDTADLDIMKAYFFGPPGPSNPDTDGDNIPDKSDNCILVANSDQRDTDNDGFGNICDPDLTNDLIVNVADLAILRQVFGTNDENADFNGDGTVDTADLDIMKAYFYGPPGPSGVAPTLSETQ
ncbi:MAG: hypothetical protein AMJ53_09350 [Gammaproteobacteria bacterium SG8_11]|nr:MAG: hypothetical protein AMJ53_09350 [Gammaproteobacteria bacterium SG8_11]